MISSSCEQFERWISLKVDGELATPAARSALETHLAHCRPCRDLLESESRRSSLLRAALSSPAVESRSLGDSILQSASGRLPGRSGSPLRFEQGPWRLWVAAAALFILGSWLGWHAWPARELASPLLRVTVEETVEDSHFVQDRFGQPLRQDLERRRLWPVPTSIPNAELDSADDTGVGYEQVQTRNVKLVSWPWR